MFFLMSKHVALAAKDHHKELYATGQVLLAASVHVKADHQLIVGVAPYFVYQSRMVIGVGYMVELLN